MQVKPTQGNVVQFYVTHHGKEVNYIYQVKNTLAPYVANTKTPEHHSGFLTCRTGIFASLLLTVQPRRSLIF